MAHNHEAPDLAAPESAALQRGYEAENVRTGVIWILLAGFGLLFAGIVGGLYLLYRHEHRVGLTGGPASVVSTSTLRSDAPPLQPQPGHESLDAWDLAKMRAEEDATFTVLGWTRDERTHRFVVPAAIVDRLRQKYATSMPSPRPAEGGE